MITLHHSTMIEDDIKEKVFVLLVMVLIGLSFALHIPKMIQTWNDTKYIKTAGMVESRISPSPFLLPTYL